MPNGPLLKPDQIFQMIISSQRTDGAEIRLKNGTEIKNSSDYVIKHSVHLPDYTTNTLSYVQSSLLLNISAWENGLVSSVLGKDSLTLTETWLTKCFFVQIVKFLNIDHNLHQSCARQVPGRDLANYTCATSSTQEGPALASSTIFRSLLSLCLSWTSTSS